MKTHNLTLTSEHIKFLAFTNMRPVKLVLFHFGSAHLSNRLSLSLSCSLHLLHLYHQIFFFFFLSLFIFMLFDLNEFFQNMNPSFACDFTVRPRIQWPRADWTFFNCFLGVKFDPSGVLYAGGVFRYINKYGTKCLE